MNFDKVQTEKSVVNQVVNQIKSAIINHELKSGDKIPTEIELMEQFNIGRNSIREAIKILVALGVLEVRRGQGTFVVDHVNSTFFDPLVFAMILEPGTNYNLYELRLSFDSMIMFMVMDKITDEQFAMLEDNINNVIEAKASHPENIDYFVEQDLAFHRLLMDYTDNPLIIKIGNSILELFPDHIRRSISQKHGIQRSIDNHLSIIKTIRNKDKAHVFNIIETSLAEWKTGWPEESL